MRMSCNGCRVLRKGCGDGCSIRPCLQWIKSPESQANATVFLAKFYGRAGLVNLINAGPDHLRPAIFQSLLYEACGRIVNPIYGSVGLLWSGNWQLCQAAVEAVLNGAPVTQIPFEIAATASSAPPLHRACSYDIRHVSKGKGEEDLHRVNRATRPRFKRSGSAAGGAKTRCCEPSASEASEPCSTGGHRGENETVFSVETADASMVTTHGVAAAGEGKAAGCRGTDDGEVELELRLGLEPAHQAHSPRSSSCSSSLRRRRGHSPTWSSSRGHAAGAEELPEGCAGGGGGGEDAFRVDLRLDLHA
uniref:LOB domain-containing protein 41 n=1 Tax=Anthurium amnicola TaxID=1678845 RepID=A0A1D1Z0C1_9ARAE